MNAHLISIVIPVYNTKRERIERCIQSVLKQTYPDYEVIVVNDGSREDYLETIEEVCTLSTKIALFSQENGGAGAARNYGVEKAKGDYVLFLDADDMLSEYALEDAVECLKAVDADLVVGQVHKGKETDWDGQFIGKDPTDYILLSDRKDYNEYINHILGFLSKRYALPDRYFCDGPVAKLCRRSLLQDSMFDRERFWSEDTIWNVKFTKCCQKAVISSNVWYYAFANEDSQTHIFRPNCEYEFKYRIRQEKELITALWPDCTDGLYAQIWISTHYLFACYLGNEENRSRFAEKYRTFLSCIREPAYQEMLQNITFGGDDTKIKRLTKKLLRHLSLHGPKLLAYLGWVTVIRARKGER